MAARSSPQKHRVFVGVAVALLLTSSTRRGVASPSYPGIVESIVGATSPPRCTICHETPSGGLGTATKAFATYLRSRGLVANDEGSLGNALAAAKSEAHDADNDGTTDLDELKVGADPNGTTADSAPPPQYGCGNVSGGTVPSTWSSTIGAIALGCLLWRGRRPRQWRASEVSVDPMNEARRTGEQGPHGAPQCTSTNPSDASNRALRAPRRRRQRM